MAFEPKRLTHPGGKFGDVVVENATDYSNFLYRDGYVVAEDQSGLPGQADEVDFEQSEPATTEPPKQLSASERRKREREEREAAEANKGQATDAQGETVPTA